VGTVNIGSRASACTPFNVALRERGPTAIQGKRPRSGRRSDWFSNPEITFLTPVSQQSPFPVQFISDTCCICRATPMFISKVVDQFVVHSCCKFHNI
jgi:hypothetical protein